MGAESIVVSAVVLRDARDRLLLVRKAGTQRYMLPGGKPEAGETAAETAVREVAEELGVDLRVEELRMVGRFLAAAANEDGVLVDATVFDAPILTQHPVASAEIDELCWLDPGDRSGVGDPSALAPLLDHVLAAWPGSPGGGTQRAR